MFTAIHHQSSSAPAAKTSDAPRIAVIGGDGLFRSGLETVLTSFDFQVTHEDGPMDLALIVADGLSLAALTRVSEELRRSGAKFVAGVLTEPSVGDLSTAIRAGLDGLLARSMSRAALQRAVELILLGENIFPTRVADTAPAVDDEDDMAEALGVSVRDLSMLRFLARGLSNRAIAKEAGLPESTVKSQVRQALARIGAQNRTQAALWAIEHGLEEANGTAA